MPNNGERIASRRRAFLFCLLEECALISMMNFRKELEWEMLPLALWAAKAKGLEDLGDEFYPSRDLHYPGLTEVLVEAQLRGIITRKTAESDRFDIVSYHRLRAVISESKTAFSVGEWKEVEDACRYAARKFDDGLRIVFADVGIGG